MNDKEKMLAGEMYSSEGDGLPEIHIRCDQLCQQFNNLDPADKEGARKILKELCPHIGDDTIMEKPIQFDYGQFTKFGKRVFVNYHFTCMDTAWITIGDDVLIGPNVTLAAPLHPMKASERAYRPDENGKLWHVEYSKPITIEHDCWIGANVTVCAGVTIGHSSVIGAGAVVTRDIPPNSFAAGVPAKVIHSIEA